MHTPNLKYYLDSNFEEGKKPVKGDFVGYHSSDGSFALEALGYKENDDLEQMSHNVNGDVKYYRLKKIRDKTMQVCFILIIREVLT